MRHVGTTGEPDFSGYDELPDAVLVAGADGEVLHLNRSGVRLLGLPAAECVGRDFRKILPLVDTTGRDWWSCTDPYGGLDIRRGQPERLLELADGPHKGNALLVTARYVRDEHRRLVRLVVGMRGTGTRERVDRERAELVSTVAHEIRSPLTGVKGFTATLLAKWDRFGDEQKKTMLAAINADADRVTRLLTDLLDVSRIDAGRMVLRKRVVDPGQLVDRVVAGQVAAGQSEDRFVVEHLGELPEMWLDPDKLSQIIGNLVENAIRHGAGTVTVRIEPRADEPGAVLTVADEGEGIGPEARTRIFGKFWRAAGSGSGGTGLGLYLVRGLAQAHGGSIELADSPSGGAAFVVTLPAGRPPYEGL